MLRAGEVDDEELKLYAECQWEEFLRTNGEFFLEEAFRRNKENYPKSYKSGKDVLDSDNYDLKSLIFEQVYDVIVKSGLMDETWDVYNYVLLKKNCKKKG